MDSPENLFPPLTEAEFRVGNRSYTLRYDLLESLRYLRQRIHARTTESQTRPDQEAINSFNELIIDLIPEKTFLNHLAIGSVTGLITTAENYFLNQIGVKLTPVALAHIGERIPRISIDLQGVVSKIIKTTGGLHSPDTTLAIIDHVMSGITVHELEHLAQEVAPTRLFLRKTEKVVDYIVSRFDLPGSINTLGTLLVVSSPFLPNHDLSTQICLLGFSSKLLGHMLLHSGLYYSLSAINSQMEQEADQQQGIDTSNFQGKFFNIIPN